jgi:hypothetical protein
MVITEIKNIALAALKSFFDFQSLWSKIKQAIKLPYAKIYILLAIFFTLIFGIVTFPYDVILSKNLKNLEKNLFKSIYISETNFSIFDVIAMNNIYIILQSGSEITIRNADINLSMLRLIFNKDIGGTFQFNGLKYDSGNTQIDLNLNGDVLINYKTFDELPIKGKLNIMMNNSNVKIGEINLPDSMGGLPMVFPLIKIKSGNLEGNISDQKITITSMKIFGDITCSMNGTIAMAKTFLNSRLDLKVLADANSDALKNYREFLGKYINDRNQVVLSIRGSLSNPYIDFSQSGSQSGLQTAPDDPLLKKIQPLDTIRPAY